MAFLLRQIGIALEGIHQKNGASLVQGACHPHRQGHADQEINQIAHYDGRVVVAIHIPGLLHVIERVQNNNKPGNGLRQGKF